MSTRTEVFKILLIFLLALRANAEQLAPSQYSPAFKKYDIPNQEHQKRAHSPSEGALPQSKVTLSWQPTPDAAYYNVILSDNVELKDPLLVRNTNESKIITQELSPGTYYYLVRAFVGSSQIGESKIERFVIGSPLQVSPSKGFLNFAAPEIHDAAEPSTMTEFPSYAPVRFSWKRVDGARGYRFRLWEVKDIPKSKHHRNAFRKKPEDPNAPKTKDSLRWVTEVDEPWIEVLDAPYSSFMYLDTATYRFDVAAVDKKTGKVGEISESYFKVDRDWYLKKGQFDFKIKWTAFPNANYNQASPATLTTGKYTYFRNKFELDGLYWLHRKWGAEAFIGANYIRAGKLVQFLQTGAGIHYRKYMSPLPKGSIFSVFGKVELRTFPLVTGDNVGARSQSISYPRSFGPKLGTSYEFALKNVFSGNWRLKPTFALALPAMSLTKDESAQIRPKLNFEMDIEALYPLTNRWNFISGLYLEHYSLHYIAAGSTLETKINFPVNYALQFGLLYRFVPDTEIKTRSQ